MSVSEKEMISLEIVSSILKREESELNNLKRKMDFIFNIIEEVSKKEESFLNELIEAKKINGKMLLLFEETTFYKDVSLINQELKAVELEYKNESSSFQKGVMTSSFDEDKLRSFSDKALKLLLDKSSSLDRIRDVQKSKFDNAMNGLRSTINTTSRLLKALVKIVKGDPKKHDMERLLNDVLIDVQKIEKELPLNISDLLKREDVTLKGAYRKADVILSEHRKNLRKIAIENRLLDEIEMELLEAIYKLSGKEFRFDEIIELVKEHMSRKKDEEIQSALISLSEKGFLTLKVIVE